MHQIRVHKTYGSFEVSDPHPGMASHTLEETATLTSNQMTCYTETDSNIRSNWLDPDFEIEANQSQLCVQYRLVVFPRCVLNICRYAFVMLSLCLHWVCSWHVRYVPVVFPLCVRCQTKRAYLTNTLPPWREIGMCVCLMQANQSDSVCKSPEANTQR